MLLEVLGGLGTGEETSFEHKTYQIPTLFVPTLGFTALLIDLHARQT